MSSAPTSNGIRKFPNAAMSTGIATQKIMIEPWFVTAALYSPGDMWPNNGMSERPSKLHTEGVGEETADQRHEHPGKQVLLADVLVVGREDVLLNEGHLVMAVVMTVVVTVAIRMGMVRGRAHVGSPGSFAGATAPTF